MSILLRSALPEDAARLAAVEVASWRAAYGSLMSRAFLDGLSTEIKAEEWERNLRKHEHSRRKRVIAATDKDAIVGFVRVGTEENVGLIYLLYLLPEFWGCGIGKALMNAAMEELCALGASEVMLWVLRDNERARRFYEGLGWRADGQTRFGDYGGIELEALCYRRAVS